MHTRRLPALPVLICAAVMLLAARQAGAQAPLDALLRPYLAGYGLPALAAAVARNGEIIAIGAVGTRRAGTAIPVDVADRFHIGSDTKAMTALLAAMLVEEGKLRWNTTTAETFPELAAGMDPGFATVTLEHLLSHTGGVPPDNESLMEVWKEAMSQEGDLDAMRRCIVDAMGKKPLISPPGQKFAYSNMGYVIAGAMIERAAGKTWDELMVQRLFTPLGLTTAGLGCQATLGKVDAPLGHSRLEEKTQAVLAGPNCDNPSLIGPAGIAHMSIGDFARWAAWNAGEGKRGPALVKPMTLRRLHTPVAELPPKTGANPAAPEALRKYALGWGVVGVDFIAHPVLQHNGSNNLNLANIWVDVENDLAIVITTNIAGQKAEEALNALVRELYAKYAVPSGG